MTCKDTTDDYDDHSSDDTFRTALSNHSNVRLNSQGNVFDMAQSSHNRRHSHDSGRLTVDIRPAENTRRSLDSGTGGDIIFQSVRDGPAHAYTSDSVDHIITIQNERLARENAEINAQRTDSGRGCGDTARRHVAFAEPRSESRESSQAPKRRVYMLSRLESGGSSVDNRSSEYSDAASDRATVDGSSYPPPLPPSPPPPLPFGDRGREQDRYFRGGRTERGDSIRPPPTIHPEEGAGPHDTFPSDSNVFRCPSTSSQRRHERGDTAWETLIASPDPHTCMPRERSLEPSHAAPGGSTRSPRSSTSSDRRAEQLHTVRGDSTGPCRPNFDPERPGESYCPVRGDSGASPTFRSPFQDPVQRGSSSRDESIAPHHVSNVPERPDETHRRARGDSVAPPTIRSSHEGPFSGGSASRRLSTVSERPYGPDRTERGYSIAPTRRDTSRETPFVGGRTARGDSIAPPGLGGRSGGGSAIPFPGVPDVPPSPYRRLKSQARSYLRVMSPVPSHRVARPPEGRTSFQSVSGDQVSETRPQSLLVRERTTPETSLTSVRSSSPTREQRSHERTSPRPPGRSHASDDRPRHSQARDRISPRTSTASVASNASNRERLRQEGHPPHQDIRPLVESPPPLSRIPSPTRIPEPPPDPRPQPPRSRPQPRRSWSDILSRTRTRVRFVFPGESSPSRSPPRRRRRHRRDQRDPRDERGHSGDGQRHLREDHRHSREGQRRSREEVRREIRVEPRLGNVFKRAIGWLEDHLDDAVRQRAEQLGR